MTGPQKTKRYQVVGTERLRFAMEVEATSKAEARRKFADYTKDGAIGWDSAGTSVRVVEIRQERGDSEDKGRMRGVSGKKPFPGRAALMGTERQDLLVAAYGQVRMFYVIDWRTHASWYEIRGGRGRAVEYATTPFYAEWRFDKTCRELYDGEAE